MSAGSVSFSGNPTTSPLTPATHGLRVAASFNHYCTNFEKRYPIGVCTAKLIEYIELSTVVHKRNEALDGRYLRKSNLKGRGLFPNGKRSMIRFKEEITEWAQIDAPAGAENDVHGTNDQEGQTLVPCITS
jgi:hypothetical protein